MVVRDVMCATCGFEVLDAESKDQADAKHKKFDPAHEANWWTNDEPVKEWR